MNTKFETNIAHVLIVTHIALMLFCLFIFLTSSNLLLSILTATGLVINALSIFLLSRHFVLSKTYSRTALYLFKLLNKLEYLVFRLKVIAYEEFFKSVKGGETK